MEELRGKDFNNGHKSFKNWSGPQKAAFVEELYEIAGRHLISGVSSTVNKSHFRKLKAQRVEYRKLSPLGFVFASAVLAVTMKDTLRRLPPTPVSFIVELGNKNNDNLVRYFKWLKCTTMGERLGSLSFVDKHDCRAIQLADFLAFHGRREADGWDRSGYATKQSIGEAMKIMVRYVYHRHNRGYDSGEPLGWADIFGLPDDKTGAFLPGEGMR